MSDHRGPRLDPVVVAAADRLAARVLPLARDLPAEAVPDDFLTTFAELAEAAMTGPPSASAGTVVPPAIEGDSPLALDLVTLAERLRTGELRAVEVTAAALDALDGLGRELGAVVRLRRAQALERAEELDARRRRGRPVGPLHGVPLAHKDMFPRAGESSECGARLFRGRRPAVTATVIARLEAAGAIDLGRLAMVEIALGVTGHNPHDGTPRNPWNPSRITGGSSSGSAAVVAAHCVPAALGSDTGGSIRIPAAFCGLVGLKPSFALVPRTGAMPLSRSLDHVGPLCRHARDLALLLGVLAGPDAGDPATLVHAHPWRPPVWREDLAGVRILAVEDVPEARVQGRVRALFARALERLEAAGATIEPGTLPAFEALQAARRALLVGEAAALHLRVLRTRPGAFAPHTLARLLPGLALGAGTLETARRARAALLRRFCREVFARYDLIATPTVPLPAPGIEETDTGGDARFVRLSDRIGALVGPFNYLGLPALSVPMGTLGGLPMGLQLVGPPGADAELLAVADLFERLRGPLGRPVACAA